MAVQKVKCNLVPSLAAPVTVSLHQFDKTTDSDGKVIEVELYNGKELYAFPTGAKVIIRATKPDRTFYEYACTYEGSVISVEIKEQMTAVKGRYFAELRLTKNGNIIGSASFMIYIEPSTLADAVVSESDIPLIEKASQAYDFCVSVQDKVEEAKASAESAIQTKAEIEALKDEVKAETLKAGESESKAKEYADRASAFASLAGGSSESASRSAASALSSAKSAADALNSSVASASDASKSASAASEAVNISSQNAANASQSAENAAASAAAASTKASEANESATNAKASETKSETSEHNAEKSAASALSSAKSASESAADASSKAAEASKSAESAGSSAASASDSETNARKSELNAKTSEEKSAESESNSKVFYDKIVATQFPYNLEGFSQLEKEITARYESARTGKVFAIRHKKFTVDPSPVGEKLLDSVGLNCTPSTDTVQGQDDFMQYLPFQWEHCNYIRDADDGFARPTAIEGRENYKNSGNVDVGCISATFWWKRVDTDADYTIYLSDMPHPELALVPWYEAVKADGSVLPYYIGSAYSSVSGDDELPRSLPGGVPLYNQSHNGNIVSYQKKGKGYWGCGNEYITHGAIFSDIKYGTPNIQQYAQGCVGFNVQKKCAVAETATTRVLIDKQDFFYAGCCVSVGVARSSDGNTDRGLSEIHSIANRVKVKTIETVEIEGVAYCALYLDVDTPFDTNTEVYVSSMPCFSGETDAVIDHYDGSFMSYSNNCHTFRLHGREYLDGMYFTSANTALLMKDGNWHVMHARKGMQHNTELTGYDDVGYIPYNDGTDYWCGDWECDMATGVSYPSSVGKSNVMGAGDMVYAGGKNVKEGEKRNHLCLGDLWSWSIAGLFFVNCWSWLGDGGWNSASRD